MKRTHFTRHRTDRANTYQAEIDAMTPLVKSRAGGSCEICKSAPVHHIHHRLLRSQGGKNTMSNLLGVCWLCHTEVHNNPEWSYEHGYLLKGHR